MGSSQLTLLLVDDDPLVRASISWTLEDEGYNVLQASGAQEALDILARRSDIRLMVSDVNMPERDGLSLAQEVHDRWPQIRFVIVSGLQVADARIPDHGRFIRKPFRPQALIEELKSLAG